jgi:hypothetical protein
MFLSITGWWFYKPLLLGVLIPIAKSFFLDWKSLHLEEINASTGSTKKSVDGKICPPK